MKIIIIPKKLLLELFIRRHRNSAKKLIGLRVMFGQTQSMLYCAKLYYPVSASWLLGAIPEFHGSTLKNMTVIKRYIFQRKI
jgi:hypothetical protein